MRALAPSLPILSSRLSSVRFLHKLSAIISKVCPISSLVDLASVQALSLSHVEKELEHIVCACIKMPSNLLCVVKSLIFAHCIVLVLLAASPLEK